MLQRATSFKIQTPHVEDFWKNVPQDSVKFKINQPFCVVYNHTVAKNYHACKLYVFTLQKD